MRGRWPRAALSGNAAESRRRARARAPRPRNALGLRLHAALDDVKGRDGQVRQAARQDAADQALAVVVPAVLEERREGKSEVGDTARRRAGGRRRTRALAPHTPANAHTRTAGLPNGPVAPGATGPAKAASPLRRAASAAGPLPELRCCT